ncbi:unnamed protein product, partial [Bubo scandiacus]
SAARPPPPQQGWPQGRTVPKGTRGELITSITSLLSSEGGKRVLSASRPACRSGCSGFSCSGSVPSTWSGNTEESVRTHHPCPQASQTVKRALNSARLGREALAILHPRNSVQATKVSLEACREAQDGRWHQSPGKETWHPPPLGQAPVLNDTVGSLTGSFLTRIITDQHLLGKNTLSAVLDAASLVPWAGKGRAPQAEGTWGWQDLSVPLPGPTGARVFFSTLPVGRGEGPGGQLLGTSVLGGREGGCSSRLWAPGWSRASKAQLQSPPHGHGGQPLSSQPGVWGMSSPKTLQSGVCDRAQACSWPSSTPGTLYRQRSSPAGATGATTAASWQAVTTDWDARRARGRECRRAVSPAQPPPFPTGLRAPQAPTSPKLPLELLPLPSLSAALKWLQ